MEKVVYDERGIPELTDHTIRGLKRLANEKNPFDFSVKNNSARNNSISNISNRNKWPNH